MNRRTLSHVSEQTLNIKLVAASDLYGGSGLASYRLLQGLQSIGCPTKLFVQEKRSTGDYVVGPRGPFCALFGKALPYLDPLPKLAYPKRHRDAWSCNLLPNPCFSKDTFKTADVVNLHWVGGGTLPIQAISHLGKPLIWTLHDSWPFTGGCHIPYDCTRYEDECGSCPQLRSGREYDLSRIIWNRKFRAWHSLAMTIVAPSKWLASTASASSLFRHLPIQIIPNGLDKTVFNVADKLEARHRLGLPDKPRLILFFAMGGVHNWNKGADLFRDCLNIIKETCFHDEFVVVTAGTPAPADYFPIPCINLGRMDDDRQKRWMYAAADVTAVPSRSESLGYVAMESMACGTPCVGFSVGGVPDLIDHQVNGYMVDPYSVKGFAEGILWLLADQQRLEKIRSSAREKVADHFCHIVVAKQYEELYAQVLKTSSSSPNPDN